MNDSNNLAIAGANIQLKRKVFGTVTNSKGEFELEVSQRPPFNLLISFIGFYPQELEITEESTTTGIIIVLVQEVVVSRPR